MNNYEACDNRIYLLTSKLMYVLLANICFLFTTSPLIIYFFISGENLSVPILTFLGILIGPALATMFSVTRRLMIDEQENAIKDYFYYYKLNFTQGIFIATLINLILMIIYVDIEYFFSINLPMIAYLGIGILLVIAMLTLYIYPILARINVKTLDLFLFSIRLAFKKFYISLTSLSLIIIVIAIVNFTGTSLIAVLFGTSGICYLILRLAGPAITEAELQLKEKYLA